MHSFFRSAPPPALASADVASLLVRRRADESGEIALRATTPAPLGVPIAVSLRSPMRARMRALRARAETAERELALMRAREQERSSEPGSPSENGELLAMLAHELRAPLSAMVGWAQIARSGTLTPAALDRALDTIARKGRVQAEILESLVDASRIASGTMKLALSVVDVAAEAERVLAAQRPIALARNIELRENTGTTALVSGDAERIRQIVRGLVSNAIRFTPTGGTVTVDVERVDDRVRVRVADTGGGIAPRLLPRIFDGLTRGDASARKHGLGLGLGIVRHLVERHAGSVRAWSDGPLRGATFEVSLPAAPAIASAARGQGQPGPCLHGVRVLVVEDDPDSLELVASVLGSAGAQVTLATCGEDALRAMDRQQHDVMVSDTMMPGMDGNTLLRAVRARSAEQGGTMPAIALSAVSRDVDRERALAAGFQVHLSKPLDARAIVLEILRLTAATGT